jgi:hypothetical protein
VVGGIRETLSQAGASVASIIGFGVTAALMLLIAIVAIRVAKWLGAGADPHVPEEATAATELLCAEGGVRGASPRPSNANEQEGDSSRPLGTGL